METGPSETHSHARRLPAWAPTLLLVLALAYVLYAFGSVTLRSIGLWERDGYFHARLANLFFEQGVSPVFRWTQASTWNGQWCDKEFLFHLLMAPFARDAAEPVRGAQIFGVLLAFGVVLTMYGVLRRNGARWPLLFALLLTCMGLGYLYRLLMLRSHVLSMILVLIGMHFLIRRNWKALALLGFVYAWSYTVPLVLVIVAVPFVLGRTIGGDPLDWRSPLAALAGVLLGLIIHPNTPYSFENFLANFQVMWQASGYAGMNIQTQQELLPYSTRLLLLSLPLYHVILLALAFFGWAMPRRVRPETLGALAAALAWYPMVLLYSRCQEYAVPLLVLALGLVVRDVLEGVDVGAFIRQRPRRSAAAMAAVIVALAAAHINGMNGVHGSADGCDPPRFRGAAEWMKRNLNPGETVAQLYWEDFPDLFYDGYRQNFLWGLDPIYSFRSNPAAAQKLENMRLRRVPLDAAWLAQTFQARVLILKHLDAVEFPELRTPLWKPVYADQYATIFALAGTQGPPTDGRFRRDTPPMPALPLRDVPLE